MLLSSLDVEVTRGGLVESSHRVHAVAMRASNEVVLLARDPELVTYWRSCAKPFQVMPLLENGGLDRLGWDSERLALACASHGGEPEHVTLAQAMLQSIDCSVDDLACGPHWPLSDRGAKMLRAAGARPTRLHNNCSGKHAAMLARAHTAQWPLAGYQNREHPVQQSCLHEVAKWSGVLADRIPLAVDGCGCTVFALPLSAMARAYAGLAQGVRQAHELPTRVVDAMTKHAFLVGGTGRFDTAIMEVTAGRVIAKIGAEGVHSLAIVDEGIGIALKAEDGAQRAQLLAAVTILQRFGALPNDLPERLRELVSPGIRNTRDELVGEVRIASVS